MAIRQGSNNRLRTYRHAILYSDAHQRFTSHSAFLQLASRGRSCWHRNSFSWRGWMQRRCSVGSWSRNGKSHIHWRGQRFGQWPRDFSIGLERRREPIPGCDRSRHPEHEHLDSADRQLFGATRSGDVQSSPAFGQLHQSDGDALVHHRWRKRDLAALQLHLGTARDHRIVAVRG
jgi:hypothetical protein